MGTRKARQYTQTTLDADPQISTAVDKNEAANASGAELTEASLITLGTLRTELRKGFDSYSDTLKSVIRTEMEGFCKELRDEILTLRETTKADINSIREELTGKVERLFTLQSEVIHTQKEMEHSLSDTSDRLTSLENSLKTVTDEQKKLQEKCIDLENRSRRQNIKILNIPEGSEKNQPTEFVAKLLAKTLGEENFTSPIVVDRAHRSLAPKPRNGERPRPMIARLHYYADKEKIMSLSRAKGKLIYEGAPIHIFPDMSPEVGRQRAAFNQVKSRLRTAGIPYRMRFPAKLEVTVDGSTMTFSEPRAVARYIETNVTPED